MVRNPLVLCLVLLSGLVPVPTAGAAEPGNDEARRLAWERAAEYSARLQGLSLLILQDGEIVFERYANGGQPDKAYGLASGSKSFWGLAAVAAAEDGLLSLDERASDTLVEWQKDGRRDITIRQLLNLTSGLDPGTATLRGPEVDDRYAYAVGLPLLHPPGTVFQYGPASFFAFGELLRRKLRARRPEGPADPLAYLQRRLLDPIGLEVGDWRRDRAGNPLMPFGAALTARQWAKLGRFLLAGGVWEGKRLLRRDSLAECWRPSAQNPAYGLAFWLEPEGKVGIDPLGRPVPDLDFIPAGSFSAAGFGNQRLYVSPALDLVVVHQGRGFNQWTDGEFLTLLLGLKGDSGEE